MGWRCAVSKVKKSRGTLQVTKSVKKDTYFLSRVGYVGNYKPGYQGINLKYSSIHFKS